LSTLEHILYIMIRFALQVSVQCYWQVCEYFYIEKVGELENIYVLEFIGTCNYCYKEVIMIVKVQHEV